jgi:type VII secretion protein EccE
VTFIRFHGLWAYQWLALGIRYASRRRTLPGSAAPDNLLRLLSPDVARGTVDLDGAPVGVLEDLDGLTATVEVGDGTGALPDAGHLLPWPGTLLPTAAGDQPRVRLQLLVAGVAAPGPRVTAGASATSYRQLTDGRLPGHARTFVVLRVLRAEGWAEADLRRALAGLVRRAARRLPGARPPAAPDSPGSGDSASPATAAPGASAPACGGAISVGTPPASPGSGAGARSGDTVGDGGIPSAVPLREKALCSVRATSAALPC